MSSAAVEIIAEDNARGFFPLDSNRILCRIAGDAIHKFVYENILSGKETASRFQRAHRADVLKRKGGTRRVLVLDPYATYFFYDFLIRNGERITQGPVSARAERFGYIFTDGKAANASAGYSKFRLRRNELANEYDHFLRIDIQNCFNSIYHHDITAFVERRCPGEQLHFGKFLRENNGDRSIYCLPQGLLPGKTIGNAYLEFIENYSLLRADRVIRFMDDVVLFSNDRNALVHDLYALQRVLGNHALALNEAKTQWGVRGGHFIDRYVDDIKVRLLKARRELEHLEYADEYVVNLDAEEIDYLKNLLKSEDASYEDADLALSLLMASGINDLVHEAAKHVLQGHTYLIKSLHRYIDRFDVPEVLLELVAASIRKAVCHEYELFWVARILRDLANPYHELVAKLLLEVYYHGSATAVVKAVVLEERANPFGLEETKLEVLRNPSSVLETLCAAVGLVGQPKGQRNSLYRYASNTGPFVKVALSELEKVDMASPSGLAWFAEA